MTKQQHTPMAYNPFDGTSLADAKTTACAFRQKYGQPGVPWRYNPWTGQGRDVADIYSDPNGILIIPPGERIYAAPKHDSVNHPKHYTSHPSGIECIQVTEHMGFNLGNAFKYIWRADLKHDAIEDLKKARWYLEREIAKREKVTATTAKEKEKANA